ncbi:ecm27p [Saccharomyces arboricola H-6]|uniref:Ecm27p n=1 Tax=Saccharomyces arboricola (strain H-6 / AS 2.3317 / CBS 10644) TaxID=1160507 RepID=J8PLX1_SACAR|nr:ecm27p [Saccharomyces arboricola H-6]
MDWAINVAHPQLLYEDPKLSVTFIVPSLFHIIIAFVLLGICASDFLCPNVAHISDPSNLRSNGSLTTKPQSHASHTGALMAVLLSWCNSSPDLFSNLMSWATSTKETRSTSASLSIGEVLGACGIILCIVEGSIFIIMSRTQIEISPIQKLSILRDLIFTLVAMCVMSYVSFMNQVTVLNCLLMVFIYAFYLVVKLTFKLNRSPEITTDATAATSIRENSISPFSDDSLMASGLLPPVQPSFDVSNSITHGIKPSLLSAMDFNSFLSMLENSSLEEDDPRNEMAELNTLRSLTPAKDWLATATIDAGTTISTERPFSEPANGFASHADSERAVNSSPAIFAPYHDNPEDGESQEQILLEPPAHGQFRSQEMQRISKKSLRWIIKIFLPHLSHFSQKSTSDAIFSVVTIPFFIIFKLSCPQPPTDMLSYDATLNKYSITTLPVVLLFIQSVTAPLLFFNALSILLASHLGYIIYLLSLTLSIGLTLLLTALITKVNLHNKFTLSLDSSNILQEKLQKRKLLERLNTSIQVIFLAIGIINIIIWISLLANCLIEMMEIYQQILGLSKAILGLTIFAWGNSIGDLISNISMCKLYKTQTHYQDRIHLATKFFMISCASCLGGVMLNSMGGIGFSGLTAMLFIGAFNDNDWWFLRKVKLQESGQFNDKLNYKFVVSCIFIILQIILLLMFFGGPKKIKRYLVREMKLVGIFMCGLWALATLINVLLELFS